LKKLANWTWKGPHRQNSHRKNRINWTKIGWIIKIRPILSTVWNTRLMPGVLCYSSISIR
ncbi:hypothetical protein C6W27_07135, partial [Bacillus paralicheniformis]